MTFGMYMIIAAIFAPVFIAVILTLIHHNLGDIDGLDIAYASFVGIIAGFLWIIAIVALVFTGIGYLLFTQFNSAIEKIMKRIKR